MLIETLSAALGKALPSNILQTQFQSLQTLTTAQMGFQSGQPSVAGQYLAGFGGTTAPNRVFVMPYCEGQPGASFSMRVYGWRSIDVPDANVGVSVWMPFPLAELTCTSGTLGGPQYSGPGQSPDYLKDSEYLCSAITLARGQTGPSGFISSTMNATLEDTPPQGFAAFALIELCGAELIQFDFQTIDTVSMNAFWARA